MKNKIRIKALVAATVFAVLFAASTGVFNGKTVQYADAGIISTDFGDSEKVKNVELDSAKWFFTDSLAASSLEYAYVLFGTETTAEDRLINRNAIHNLAEYGQTEQFTLKTVFQMMKDSNMADAPRSAGIRWGASFGLSYAGAGYGEAGSVFIGAEYISSGVYDMVIVAFDENGESELNRIRSNTIAEGKKTTMVIKSYVNGNVEVVMSGNGHTDEKVFEMENVMPKSGYFGYVQSATMGCRLYRFDMFSLAYGNPENVNVYETFSNDCYNAEVLYSQAAYGFKKGNGLTVKDGKLTFKDAAGAFISTKYVYSNAEIAFDIPDMRRTGGYDGKYYIPETSAFGVCFGATSYKEENANYRVNVKFYKDGYDSRVSLDFAGKEKVSAKLPEKFNVWSDETVNGRTVKIRLLMVDGVVSVGIKYAGESAYKEILNYTLTDAEMSENVDGYIRLYADGNASDNGEYSVLSNMTVDNLSITNFDRNANTVTAGYRSNVWHTEDYDYIDKWDDNDLLK